MGERIKIKFLRYADGGSERRYRWYDERASGSRFSVIRSRIRSRYENRHVPSEKIAGELTFAHQNSKVTRMQKSTGHG